jgi:assimilatory nitrate reductase catalytic subunit
MDALPAQRYGRALLVPGSTPPVPVVSRGTAVCTCFDVTDTAITTQLAQCTGTAPERLQLLQQSLKCGTNCGSCVPEIKRIIRSATEARQHASDSSASVRAVIPIRVIA